MKERDNISMYEDELDRLEIRISYLEKQNEELTNNNQIIFEHVSFHYPLNDSKNQSFSQVF